MSAGFEMIGLLGLGRIFKTVRIATTLAHIGSVTNRAINEHRDKPGTQRTPRSLYRTRRGENIVRNQVNSDEQHQKPTHDAPVLVVVYGEEINLTLDTELRRVESTTPKKVR